MTLWRLAAVRASAWALLLGSWVGLSSLAQGHAAGPWAACSVLAGWLLALGGFVQALGRWRPAHSALAWALPAASIATAVAAGMLGHHGGLAGLGMLALAAAALLALASAAVRVCRLELGRRPASPQGSAAVGALAAWLVLGDITDLQNLPGRLALGALCAGCLVALLLAPWRGSALACAGPARGTCRAALFDCALPAWPKGGLDVSAIPLHLATLVMLPMMCSLPWMVALCRSNALPPQAVLGLHLLAMLLPACLLQGPWAASPRTAAAACSALLAGGAAAAQWAAPAEAWWILAVAHGAAWSVAWSDRLAGATLPGGPQPAVAAVFNATFVLACGAAIGHWGPAAIRDWQLALGGVAALAAAWALCRAAARSRRAASRTWAA